MNKILLINKIENGFRIACSNGEIHDIYINNISEEFLNDIKALNKEKILIHLYGKERKDLQLLQNIEYKNISISFPLKDLFLSASNETEKDMVLNLNNFYKFLNENKYNFVCNFLANIIEHNCFHITLYNLYVSLERIDNFPIKWLNNIVFYIKNHFSFSFNYNVLDIKNIQKSFRLNPFLFKDEKRFIYNIKQYKFNISPIKRKICEKCGYEIIYDDQECKFCNYTEKIYL